MRAKHIVPALGICVSLAGCGSYFEYDKPSAEKQREQKERDEKTREEVARATENAKPKLQEAGRKAGEAARSAAETARATAEGVREGWNRGKNGTVDLNSANQAELTALPGISSNDARNIIAGRPYKSAHQVVSAGVLTEEQYRGIRDSVVAR
jgi:DNA uptake protein ComE-like DNA-binding protein